jgi:hypothetical protein
MKKIATFILITIGLVLLGLNYSESSTTSTSLASVKVKLNQAKIVPEVENEDQSIDISKINLPTIFDALFKLR